MTKDFEGTNNFLKQFTPLLHKTMQRLNIHPQHMDYDDYYQELQIKLFDICQTFEREDSDPEIINAKFTAYAGKGLYWHALDLLRNKSHQSLQTVEADLIEREANREESQSSFEQEVYTNDFFRLAKERLSERDYQLLLQLAEDQHTMQELADEYGVVRATIYQWKNKLQENLVDLKSFLTNN